MQSVVSLPNRRRAICSIGRAHNRIDEVLDKSCKGQLFKGQEEEEEENPPKA